MQTHTHMGITHSSGKKTTTKKLHIHFSIICGIYQSIVRLMLFSGLFHGFQVTFKYTDTYEWNCRVMYKYHLPTTQTHSGLTHIYIHPPTHTHNNSCKQNPSNQDSNVPLSPHLLRRNWTTTDTTLYSPDPDCEVGSGGEHNCMLKRLRNGRPVLLSWCFLCGLIVGTCSHAALWVPVGAHVGLGVVQKSGRGGNIV